MLYFNVNGIKNSFTLFKLFEVSFSFHPKKRELETTEIKQENNRVTPTLFKEPKTTLGSGHIDLISQINDDIFAYFFIEKNKESSAWNLVAPMLLEKSTKKIYQYGLGHFALEGCGGGLSNTDTICYYFKKHKEKGYQVTFVPRIIDNKLLKSFEYLDSPTKLIDLINNSTDLISYRKGTFIWIYKQYQTLLAKYDLI